MSAARTITRLVAAAGLLLAAGCRTAQPTVATDADLGRLASAARKVFDMGEPARAVPLYRDALARARALDDASAIGAVGASLAACLLDAGAKDEALTAIREARDGLRRAGRPETDAAILEGRIALARGRTDDARAVAASLAALPAPPRPSRAAAALLSAEIALAAKEFHVARAALDTAARLAGPGDPATLLAWIAETRARLHLAADLPAAAADAFEEAAGFRGRASQAGRVAADLLAAADAREKAGDKAGGADCLYRAARALAGAGRREAARQPLERAAALAGGAPEAAGLRELIAALAAELDTTTPKP